MPGPNMIIALRGFKIRTNTLDGFLVAHGMPQGTQTGILPPIYKYDDNGNATEVISEFLRAQVRKTTGKSNSSNVGRILLVMPSVEGHDCSSWAYIAYSYTDVYAHRHITPQDPPEEIPQGFEELRQDILKHSASPDDEREGLIGLFIVFIEGRPGSTPPELLERDQTPIICGLCEHTFEMWSTRQSHRNKVHGTHEDLDALPDNA